ncbi:MAG TPA: class I tRNA ligase family protein, partial [Candidatus Dojkabacteria bacterium]|nr:class I tRNA ligase family protein [Candidatus Dojkabacteria bacterium]
MNDIKKVTIYNTPQRKKVTLIPYERGKIKMYSCGPTVYNTVHIGNLRSLVNFDVVSRAFRYLGYDLKRVVNFTDVGHMSSDSDFGEDKVERQAVKEETDPISIANKYISHVLESFRKLNVLNPNGTPIQKDINVKDMTKELWTQLGWARATDYIPEMIDFIKRIEANGHTYETEQAVYFDISTFPAYYEFFGQSLEEKQVAVRE